MIFHCLVPMKEVLRRRSKLDKRCNESDKFYSWRELNVGVDIDLLHLKIHITCCNEFTRQFYENHNVQLNENEEPFNQGATEDSNYCKVSLNGEKIVRQ